MNESLEIHDQLWALIDNARHDSDPRSLHGFRQLLFDAIGYIDKLNRRAFQAGDHVEFTTRDGETLIGVIDRINTKSISITIVHPSHYRGHSWKVGASLLRRVEPPVETLTPMSEEEANAIALRLFGAPADSVNFTASHLCERKGKHLVLVETPAHGYFVVVSELGKPKVVGEEDCGIDASWVLRFFGVDRYGQRG